MRYSLYLGKAFGVKIYIHWTFLILIGWIVLTDVSAGLGVNEILWKVALILSLFGCVVLHELGHAVTAKKYNVVTKYITLLPIGGIAQMETIPEDPKQELLIAIAGPAVNIVIALLLFPFINIQSIFQTEAIATLGSHNFLFYLATLNIWLAIFNMIPAFPMDGGRVLRALLTFRLGRVTATRIASGIGQAFGVAFFFIGLLYNPILILIGIFIFFSGQYESSIAQTSQLLHRYTVNDVIMREIPTIENSSNIHDAAQALLNTQNKNFVVTDHGKPVGTIGRDEIVKAMQEKGGGARIEDVKNGDLYFVSDVMPLDEAWNVMQQKKAPLILVGTKDNLTGIVDIDNVAEFIQLQSEPVRQR